MRAALPVIAMAVGAVAFVLAVVLRGGAGDVLSVLASCSSAWVNRPGFVRGS